jgi:hypothetical protein
VNGLEYTLYNLSLELLTSMISHLSRCPHRHNFEVLNDDSAGQRSLNLSRYAVACLKSAGYRVKFIEEGS